MHLELVTDLTPEAFTHCLSRFCSRPGKPSVFINDNLLTFTASQKIFIKLFHTKEVQSYLASKNIKWQLLLEKALWQGGGLLQEVDWNSQVDFEESFRKCMFKL